MKTCKNCGFLLNDTDRFCTHCGVVQEVNEEEVRKAEEEAKAEKPEEILTEEKPSYDYSTRYEEHDTPAPKSKRGLIMGIIGTAAAIFTMVMFLEAVYMILPEMFNMTEFTSQFTEEELGYIWKAEIVVFGMIAIAGGAAGAILGAIGIRTKNQMNIGKVFSLTALCAGLTVLVLAIVLISINI